MTHEYRTLRQVSIPRIVVALAVPTVLVPLVPSGGAPDPDDG